MMDREVIANLDEIDPVVNSAIQEVQFSHWHCGFVALDSDRPTVGVTAETQLHSMGELLLCNVADLFTNVGELKDPLPSLFKKHRLGAFADLVGGV